MSRPDVAPDWRPLTAQQADFWHDACAAPQADQGAVAHLLRLTGAVDGRALRRAIMQALHEADVLALRLARPADAGLPLQSVDPQRRPVLRCLDLRAAPDPEATARARLAADLAQPPDLLHRPLAAHALLRLGPRDWLWMARGHHMILDAYAMALIETRAARLYAADVAQGDPGPPLRPFTAYLDEEAQYLAGAGAKADRDFWRAAMQDAPPLATVVRGDGAPAPAAYMRAVPGALSEALVARADAMGASWPDLLTLAAAAVLIDHPALPAIHRRSPGCLTVWRAEMGRLGSVAAAVPALVVNLLPLPLSRGPNQGLAAFLRDNVARLRYQRRHARWRFERLADDLGIAPPLRPFISPLINIMPFTAPEFPGCCIRHEVVAAGPSDGLTLTFRASPSGGGLSLIIEADPRLTALHDLGRLADDLMRGLAQASLVPYF